MPSKFIQQSASFLVRKPLIAAGTMAAAVSAPFFAKSEDRGYFRSALITTPIIFAASAYVPNVLSSPRKLAQAMVAGNQAINKIENNLNFTGISYGKLNALFKDPSTQGNTLDRALSAFLVTENKVRKYEKERKVLDKYFYRHFVKSEKLMSDIADSTNPARQLEAIAKGQVIENLHDTKGRLISNAIHSARRSSLTPAEWAEEGANTLGILDNEQMISMYQKYKERDPFVRTLANRLRKVNKLNDTGMSIASDSVIPSTTKMATLDATGAFYPVEEALQNQRPEVMESLQTALGKGYVNRVEVTAETVTSGEIGRVLNVRVFRRGNTKGLVIPIVDPHTGSVRLPNAVGVGNRVIGPDLNAYYIDEWISKMLLENGSDFDDEMLQAEINKHAYYMAGDPMDSHRMFELASKSEGGDAIMNGRAIKTRSHSAGFTSLPFYKNKEGQRISALELEASQRTSLLRDVMNTGQFVPMGSESGVSELRFQTREAANLSPFGGASAQKQDPIWRSITKEMHLGSREGLPADANLKWSSTAWESLTGSSTLPAVNLSVGSVAPQNRMFFADLPSSKEEFEGAFGSIMDNLKGMGMSRENAIATFEELHDVYNRGEQGIFKSLGRMGETGFLVKEGFANNLFVEGRSKYRVDTLARDVSGQVGVNDVLGFTGAEAVTPDFAGTIESISRDEAGNGFYLNILHEHALQGAKIDAAGIKGMVAETPSDTVFDTLRETLNRFTARTGQAGFLPENINTLAPLEYYANKVEPTLAYLGISGDVLSRLGPDSPVATDYLASMAGEGVNYVNGQMVIDAARNPLHDNEVATRLIRLANINEEFFKIAGDAVRKAGSNDPVLSGYMKSGQSLRDFYMQNFLPSITMAWNHSTVNVPKFASITHDVETYLAASGNFRSLKALKGRVQTLTGGDADKGKDFLKYVYGGDFNKELGTVVPLDRALNGTGSLASPINRAGTIFDPSVEAYKESFRLDLGEGGKYRYLPVPGTNVYGAEASMYGEGNYAVHDFQRDIKNLYSAPNVLERDRMAERVLQTYKEELGMGKRSVFRPTRYDPLGAPGFLSTSAEGADPFVARVSPDWVAKLRDKKMREAFNPGGKGVPGEGVYGLLLRQPTQETLHLKYVMDPKMKGTFDVAVDEAISRAYSGDQDQDLISALLWAKGTDAEQEAIEAINNGKQQKMLDIWKSYKGDGEIARQVTEELTSLSERNIKFASAVADRTGVAIKRTAAASIGQYSNVLTGMMEQIVRNPVMMRDPDLVQRLKTGLFDIRQAPINARKAHNQFDLEMAEKLANKLNAGMRSGSTDLVHEAMLSISESLTSKGKAGPEYAYWADQGRLDTEAMMSGKSKYADIMSKVLTSKSEYGSANLEQAFAMGIEDVIGPVHGNRMAAQEASKLGMVSEYLASVGRNAGSAARGKVGREIASHGKSLAIGLGALAALGVVMTPRTAPQASFNRTSANKYRPEALGVADNIPGEAVPGYMAPGNPPRRMEEAPRSTRTAVVAPLSRTSDLSVKMNASDRNAVAETIRQVAQVPGTDSTNVTVNYRDRNRYRSLRSRDKIRDILGTNG